MEWILKYWIEWLFGLICAALGIAYKRLSAKVKAQHEEDKAIKDGLLALLHDRLYQACTCYLTRGHIDVEALKNIEYMYSAYHALGGNGTGTALYEKVKALPIKDDQRGDTDAN